MGNSKRTFIAIDFPFNTEMRDCLKKLTSSLSTEKIKWISEHQSHLTLKFLGDTDEGIISSIKEELEIISQQFSPFTINVRNVGVFNPKIIWFGIEKNDTLIQLQSSIEKAIEILGFETEKRDFSPHLTIGRIKFLRDKKKLHEVVGSFKEISLQNLTISEVVYYESILKGDGSEYIPLGKFKIGL
jgi:RNA 2',3'-cyclic 3'-phosphodiesterase